MIMKWGRYRHAVNPMDVDDIVQEIEQNIEWFCDMIVEPIPLNPKDKDKIMKRMVNLGWLRQSELDTYKDFTRKD